MDASLSILLAVLAQAAAPAPASPSCNPPCAPGQYCAPNGQCYVPAPVPAPPAQNQPPPASYPPAQGAPTAPTGNYPAPQDQQLPPSYDQQPNQPPPGYDQQQPNQPPPGYYQPAPGYAQPGYQQPGYPPPGVYQPQGAPVQPSPYKPGPRFGLFLGGIVLPGANVSAAAGGALLTFGSEAFGWESRIYGAFFNVEDEDTKTEGAAFFWHSTRWWGVYGLGFGSGVGYADFTAKTIYGWNDTSGQLLAYIAPVMLRFGRQPTFELGLNSGATLFFSHDVRPYGYAYGGILF
ncbi:MAG TPA: hypothetical protein VN903_26055 [Polyangia bacterium]|jgi:hypothetical protein|nr:hypothetical protein [Polyangia bacterium]